MNSIIQGAEKLAFGFFQPFNIKFEVFQGIGLDNIYHRAASAQFVRVSKGLWHCPALRFSAVYPGPAIRYHFLKATNKTQTAIACRVKNQPSFDHSFSNIVSRKLALNFPDFQRIVPLGIRQRPESHHTSIRSVPPHSFPEAETKRLIYIRTVKILGIFDLHPGSGGRSISNCNWASDPMRSLLVVFRPPDWKGYAPYRLRDRFNLRFQASFQTSCTVLSGFQLMVLSIQPSSLPR